MKITHNLKNKKKPLFGAAAFAVGGGGAQPGWSVCARWHTGLADGSCESVQMGECPGDSSPQQLLPFPRLQGGGASERGKAQPEPKSHRAGGGEKERSELGNRAGLPPPLAEGTYQQTTLSSLDVAQATPALPTSPPPLPVRSASQVPGPGFRFLLH